MKKYYRLIKDTNFKIITNKKKITILWNPVIEDEEDYFRELSRAIWYINPVLNRVEQIIFITSEALKEKKFKLPNFADETIEELYQSCMYKITCMTSCKKLPSFKFDLVVNWKRTPESRCLKKMHPYCIDGSAIDNQFETNQMMKISKIFLSRQEKKKNAQKLKDFLNTTKKKNISSAYIFGSGPSLGLIKDMNFELDKSFSIVCNSVVKNINLLHKINPNVVVATDSLFHAGYSKYAEEFRRSLTKALDVFQEMYFFVPLRDYNLYMHNLDEKYHDRIIGIKGIKRKNYNINLYKKHYLKSTSNVLTFFLLPLSASVSNNIKILGFDGKTKNDKDIFWKYDKSSQFIDSIDSTRIAHPAFYRVDYDSYYDTHCQEVENLVELLSKKKIHLEVLGNTNIPALKELQKK